MRLLVVEDSARLLASLCDGLRRSGHTVDGVGDGRQGLIHAQTTTYDLVVLDLMLPELDGLTVLRTMRERGIDTHVLILSARDRVEQRVEGLRAGADDYLVKPFAFDELLARVESLGRRAHGRKSSQISLGRVRLDLTRRELSVDGEVVELTPREYALVECLALEAGRPLSRDEIEEHVYDSSSAVWSNAVDSAVASVRRKLSGRGLEGLILTRRGLGYEITAEGGAG
ncbi:MAG: response regulator transcription factor [Phycisphaerales bacterium]|nr:response regulator transcription factor [Phycisphaerales bacterium]